MPIKLLKITEVCKLVGVSRGHVYVMMKDYGFPKPIELSERSRAWRLSDIEQWIDKRAQAA